jgi:Mor family transcriptional regulator
MVGPMSSDRGARLREEWANLTRAESDRRYEQILAATMNAKARRLSVDRAASDRRKREIHAAYACGEKVENIARHHGVSITRIYQLLKR